MKKQIKTEARYDGLWVLRTNTLYNAETVTHVYKALWTVEDIIRTAKSIMDTRPIYHRCNETTRGHVFCSRPVDPNIGSANEKTMEQHAWSRVKS
jgi:hypothetical protein